MADTIFSAVVEAKEGLTMRCKSREFDFYLDEPKELGGNNVGMNPVEALLNSIGACKAIVARCFAKAHGLDIKGIKIELEGTLNPDGFMGLDKNAKIGFSKVNSKYYFETEEDDEKLEEFVKFIEKTCPVMDTIMNAPEFTSTINKL